MLEKQESMICYQTCSWNGCNAGYDTLSPTSYLL
jgi:hypothetical protein